MYRAMGDPIAFRRRFIGQVIAPVASVFAVVVLSSSFCLYWAASSSDAVAIARQKEVVVRTIAASVDQLAYEQQSDAVWTPLAEQLDRASPDLDWLHQNTGSWLHRVFGHNQTFILDADDQVLYASINGLLAPNERFQDIRLALIPLIEKVRVRSGAENGRHDHIPNLRPAANSTARTAPTTVHASDSLEILGRPAVASVMKVARDSGESGPGRSRDALLVSVRFLDGRYLQQTAAQNLIRGLRFSTSSSASPRERVVDLADERGRLIGHFIWQPNSPGSEIISLLAPVTLCLFLILAAAMIWLTRSLWLSSRNLANTVLELKASEAQAQHLAFHDVLTGLPNRALFADRLDHALSRVRHGERVALLALDLDRFKHVNDTLGHGAGDSLIREFSRRITAMIRPIDTFARVGGDEFLLLIADISNREKVESFCDRLLAEIRAPFEILGRDNFVSLSIGVVIAPDTSTDRIELQRKADIALYHAKADGRDRYCFFLPEMDEKVKLRREIEDELRLGLVQGDQLRLHYQPQLAGNGRTIVGLEALVRWMHPERGLIPPDQFIRIAEETGLIVDLGEWVLREACRMALKWPELFMAVNLSPAQFKSLGLVDRIIQIVAQSGCQPTQFELEVTESVLVEDDIGVRRQLDKLRAVGFKIALDDFGTGYSSLSYLRKFHVDKIKIDRSFTQNLGQGVDSAAIIRSVVALGHTLGITVAAEGVETQGQREFLTAAGCNELQGYLFSKALPEEEIDHLLQGGVTWDEVA